MRIITNLALLITSLKGLAMVEPLSYKTNEWKATWSEVFYQELDDDFLAKKIDEGDLKLLHCPLYNEAELEEKKDFWLVFFASLARAESGLNERAKSKKMRGHRSYGLFQLAPETAKSQCDITEKEDLYDGSTNLTCALTLMTWQLDGAPVKNRGILKLRRPDLKGHLFGKKILLWGPLRSKDKRGRQSLYHYFESHLDQLPFCREEEKE